MSDVNEINLIAPICGTSYGLVSYNILKELHKKNIRVNLFPIGQIQGEESWKDNVVQALNNQSDFGPTAPSLRIWHQFGLAEHVGKGKHIGFPIFELNKFTDREIHHLLYCDKLFVTSQWAKDVILNNLTPRFPLDYINKNTHIIPLGVDVEIFKPNPVKHDNFIFLNIGKWEVRKGHDILIEAFNKAFEVTDNVELWMMSHNPFIDNTPWIKLYKESKLGNKIQILNRVGTQAEVAELINYCDCGVFPSRAEGWNMGLLEMMACGKPVITTNFSAHTEFCNDNNSHLIGIYNTTTAIDNIWFHGQGEWAEFGKSQMGDLVDLMQELAKYPRNNEEGIRTAHKFTWENTVNSLLGAI